MSVYGRCFFCDKIKHLAMSITEITNGNIESHQVCKECGEEFMGLDKKNEIDLSHINTPEELLSFIQEMSQDPCVCGTTIKDFHEHGRFGCPKCYEHFTQIMEQLVYPFHKANQHVGKRPMRQIMEKIENDPVEKLKLLKLKYAKALELEEYEKLADLKKQIDQVSSMLPSTFEDQ